MDHSEKNIRRTERLVELQAQAAEAEMLLAKAHELHMRLLNQDQDVINQAIGLATILGQLNIEVQAYTRAIEMPPEMPPED